MTQITVPELVDEQLQFVSMAEVMGDGDGRPPVFLNGRITAGRPQSIPVTPEWIGDDKTLRLFVESEIGRFAYHLVLLSVTFAAEPERPRLEKAAFELALTADGAVAPLASVMNPIRLSDPRKISTTLELAPTLTLTVLGQDLELGLGSWGRGEERTVHEPYLWAEQLSTPRPAWRFKKTRSTGLVGSYQLAMVVRVPWLAEWRLTGKITGSTRHMSFLRPEEADLPWPLRLRAEF